MRQMTRRELIRRALAAGIVLPSAPLLLDACSSGTASTASTATSRAASQAFVIGATKDEYVTSGLQSFLGMYPLNVNVYEPLVRLAANYSVSPQLAVRWSQTGPNTFRFHLRPGVTFHDGSPLRAADVKYTFDRIAKGGGGLVGLGLHSTVVVDDLTVDVTPTTPNLQVVQQVVHPEYSILKEGTNPGTSGPGTGPFRWVSYAPQSSVKVTRNPSYWGEKANASALTFNFIPDDTSRSLALASGQLDVAIDLARPSVQSLKARAGIQVIRAPVGAYSAMYVNIHGHSPYTIGSDPAVRLALQTGIDREALIKSVFAGLADTEHTLLPSALLGSAASSVHGFSYDPGRAAAALQAAGWTGSSGGIRSRNGKPLQLVLVNGFPDAASNAGVPEFVQANLGQIGVGITIKTEPDTNSYSAVLGAGTGDLFLETGNQNDGNPAFLPQVLFYGKPPSSYSNLFDPGASFDNLITSALATSSSSELDADVADAIHVIEDVTMVFIQLAGIFRILGIRSNVRGLIAHPSDVNQSWTSLYRVA